MQGCHFKQSRTLLFFMMATIIVSPLLLWNCEYDLSLLAANTFNLERNYEWYKTQMNTGAASANNCGPTTVSMSIKYAKNLEIDVETIRNTSYRNGDWWYPSDIKRVLRKYSVSFTIQPLYSKFQLMESLANGHIIIINLDMSGITETEYYIESHYNKYYHSVSGHFLIIKGYQADQNWFVVYDSNNWTNDYYRDGTPMGKDRFYNADEIVDAMQNWWPYFFEINAN